MKLEKGCTERIVVQFLILALGSEKFNLWGEVSRATGRPLGAPLNYGFD
jgi:hypothetical protein